MPTPKAAPTNFTGRQREKLAAENAEALKARASEIATVASAAADSKANDVIDATEPNKAPVVVDEPVDATVPEQKAAPTVLDEVEVVGVDLTEQYEVIQVLDDVQDMTYGAGNFYSFERGRKYKVTAAIANHLREKGYIY